MKTPMQELIEWINLSKEDSKANGDALTVHLDDLREFADVLLEKEKEVMCDFVEYCDEANRNYQETEESWCEDLTIDDMFDKRFNNEKK